METVKILKLFIPFEEYADYNFVGLIIGPRGATVKTIEAESGAKIAIRGKGSPLDRDDPLHVQIRGPTFAHCEKAAVMVRKLLEGINPAKLIEEREEFPASELGSTPVPGTFLMIG